MNISSVHLDSPFITAGNKYHWKGKTIGLGIATHHFRGVGNIEVTVGENPTIWVIDKEEGRNFVRRYKSFFQAKGTKLGVVAWHQFRKKEKEDKQLKLLL